MLKKSINANDMHKLVYSYLGMYNRYIAIPSSNKGTTMAMIGINSGGSKGDSNSCARKTVILNNLYILA